jgi:hypothetical protein
MGPTVDLAEIRHKYYESSYYIKQTYDYADISSNLS